MSAIIEIYAYPFMRDALVASALAGAMLGYLGIFIVLRRIVFLGAALPQLSALGIAVAVFAGFAPLAGAVGGALFGTAILSVISSRRIPADGIIGIAYALASSGAFLVVARSTEGEMHMLKILSGDILGWASSEIILMLVVFGAAALIHFVSWKEFLVVSYDPEMASMLGLRPRIWDGIFFLTLGASVALALHVSGIVVTFAFLVGPASAALLISRRFPVVIALAIFFGVASAAVGLTLSFLYDLPGGPAIAACALAPLIPAIGFRFVAR